MNNSFLLPFTTWEEIGVHNFSLKKIKLCGKEIVTSSPHENLHWIWDPERPNNLPNITIIIISRGRTLTKGTLLEYLPKMIGVTDREGGKVGQIGILVMTSASSAEKVDRIKATF